MKKGVFFVAGTVFILSLALYLMMHRHNQKVLLENSQYPSVTSSEVNEMAAYILTLTKLQANTKLAEQALADLDQAYLEEQLSTDGQKLSFWINIYNAYILIKAYAHPEMLSNEKIGFFTKKWITIAGQELSFDDIENGIIRHSKMKISLGYFNKISASPFEKRFRLQSVDWRIHFALNCGAASCPTIKIYRPEKVDDQLNESTTQYLEKEVEFNEENGVVHVPMLMMWFIGDFGGKTGIRHILREYGFLEKEHHPKIKYNKYDWSVDLDNFE